MSRPRFLRVFACSVLITCWASPTAAQANESREPHAFIDLPNGILTGVLSATLVADGIVTWHAITLPSGAFREANPLVRPFLEHGWPGLLAGGTLLVGADAGLRYVLHRKNYHRAERWMPMLLTTYAVVSVVRNVRLIQRERDRTGHLTGDYTGFSR